MEEMIQYINKKFPDTLESMDLLAQIHPFWFKQELNLDQ